MIRNKKRAALEKNEEGAKRTAVSLLAYREHTEKELYTKLTERGFSKQDAAAAVAFAVEKKYLSERRYYLRFAEFCAKSKHFGKRRIAQEAKRKGFSSETVAFYTDEALADVNFDEICYEALVGLRHTDKEKQTAALLRRGFTVGNMRYAFEKQGKEAELSEEMESASFLDTDCDFDDCT
jgi:regulatory protein